MTFELETRKKEPDVRDVTLTNNPRTLADIPACVFTTLRIALAIFVLLRTE